MREGHVCIKRGGRRGERVGDRCRSAKGERAAWDRALVAIVVAWPQILHYPHAAGPFPLIPFPVDTYRSHRRGRHLYHPQTRATMASSIASPQALAKVPIETMDISSVIPSLWVVYAKFRAPAQSSRAGTNTLCPARGKPSER